MCRMSNMEGDRVNKRIFDWALHKANGNCRNNIFKVLKFCRDNGLGIHVENLSSGWCKNVILPMFENIIFEKYKCMWHDNINSEIGPSKKGKKSSMRVQCQALIAFFTLPLVAPSDMHFLFISYFLWKLPEERLDIHAIS